MKFDRRSIGVKMFGYFLLIAAVILGSLWLLQTVFLQGLYEEMMTRALERVADRLATEGDVADFETLLDQAAFENSILVYLIESDGTVAYTTDEHRSARQGERMGKGRMQRGLPEDYEGFLKSLSESADGRIRYVVTSPATNAKTLVMGVRLDGRVLYLSTPLGPLNVTIGILRTQLLYVSAAALLLGLVVAVLMARRFSRPVAAITRQAEGLAEGRFPDAFDKGFCSELDRLSDTLTYASHELGQVETLRRELVANVSHDLRTPLTMIRAYAELIRDVSGETPERRAAHLAIIIDETDRLTALVGDMLSLSLIQSGGLTLAIEALDISQSVARVTARFEPFLATEGCRFQADIEPHLMARADEKRLEQVLYNLIGNAVNYVGADKTVFVRVEAVPGAVRVSVGDHGEGIQPSEVEHIWERYHHGAREGRGKMGTGLGLSIVKELLLLHRARFGVESRPGEGSTFWFELDR